MRSSVVDMGVSGQVQELNSGTLVLATAATGNAQIKRSTDGGSTWTTRATMTIPVGGTGVKGAFVDSRGHVYMGGNSQTCTYENYGSGYFGELWKSSDDGTTWRKVCTSETSSFWHMTEDSTGHVYVNEYSLVPTSGTEYPAVNIWRSDVTGETFSKWHTAAKETSPGLKDGVRHIHTVHIDASDRAFVCYGDESWGGMAGHVVRLNSSGVVDIDYGKFGNGSTSVLHAANGTMLVGKDNNPSGIDALNPTVAQSCQQCNLFNEAGQRFDAYVFDLVRSADGVIFGNATLSTRYASLLYSTDEGANWKAIDLGGINFNTLTLNPLGPSGCMFTSGVVKKVRVPSRVELLWRRPWYLPA